jgi:hypothetical protein
VTYKRVHPKKKEWKNKKSIADKRSKKKVSFLNSLYENVNRRDLIKSAQSRLVDLIFLSGDSGAWACGLV